MITISTDRDWETPEGKNALRQDVLDLLDKFDLYLVNNLNMDPTVRMERTLLAEFLHVASRGLLNEQEDRREIQSELTED